MPKFDGKAVDDELRALVPAEAGSAHQFVGYGETHNWTHVAALTKLEYYKDLELPHNIDVMHTEKNVGESLFHTVLNIPGKSKDNVKARVDVQNFVIGRNYTCSLLLAVERIGSSRMPTSALILIKERRHSGGSNTS